jgi:hypothetical protein
VCIDRPLQKSVLLELCVVKVGPGFGCRVNAALANLSFEGVAVRHDELVFELGLIDRLAGL